MIKLCTHALSYTLRYLVTDEYSLFNYLQTSRRANRCHLMSVNPIAMMRYVVMCIETGGPPLQVGQDRRASTSGAGKMVIPAKPHQCPYCVYITSNYAHLMRHVRTHTGEKPYACPYCPFRAAQKDNLKRHVRTHTGEKPFACDQCPYTFSEKSNLKSHMRSHHS